MKKIVIDAGHGGTDGGASANGLVEKNLTLDISNDITRPNSEASLIMNKKSEDIFPKEEELLSIEENLDKENNVRNIVDNSYQNENNINMNIHLNNNYELLENQHAFLNEERTNNFDDNYQQLNGAKNIQNFQEQEQMKFLY